MEATATPLVSAIASGDGITAAVLPWLRIAILGTPAIPARSSGAIAGCVACRTPCDRCRRGRRLRVVGSAVPAAGLRLAGAALVNRRRWPTVGQLAALLPVRYWPSGCRCTGPRRAGAQLMMARDPDRADPWPSRLL